MGYISLFSIQVCSTKSADNLNGALLPQMDIGIYNEINFITILNTKSIYKFKLTLVIILYHPPFISKLLTFLQLACHEILHFFLLTIAW